MREGCPFYGPYPDWVHLGSPHAFTQGFANISQAQCVKVNEQCVSTEDGFSDSFADFDTFFEKSDSTNESKVINQIHRNNNVNFDNSVEFNIYVESIQDPIQPSVNESGISGILSSSEPQCNKESESTQMDYSDLNKRLSVIQEMISSIGENQDSIFTSLSEYHMKNNKLEIENRKLLMKVQHSWKWI